jgi:hypothetical protein
MISEHSALLYIKIALEGNKKAEERSKSSTIQGSFSFPCADFFNFWFLVQESTEF